MDNGSKVRSLAMAAILFLSPHYAAGQAGRHPVVESLTGERPAVSDSLLEKLKGVHIENAWSVLMSHGYKHQFVGGFVVSQPDVTLVGRAVTLRYLPVRPDLEKALRS